MTNEERKGSAEEMIPLSGEKLREVGGGWGYFPGTPCPACGIKLADADRRDKRGNISLCPGCGREWRFGY